MKRVILISFFIFTTVISFGQTRNGIWYSPSKATKINGISLALLEEVSDGYHKQKNGISLVLIGSGIIFGGPLIMISTDERDWDYNDTYNGLAISLTGSMFPKVNGITGSFFIGASEDVNGLSINLVASQINNLNGLSISTINLCDEVRGVQIGLWNEANDLRGFQFGIWNINEKRSLPFINWNFKKKKKILN